MNIQIPSLILFFISFVQICNAYNPNLELHPKVGKTRNISRTSILLPVLTSSDQSHFVYFNGIGMFDNTNAKEGNLGVGYRYLSSSYILGGFVHYDIRSSKYANLHQQITMGIEYFTKELEFRLNGYVPTSSNKLIHLQEQNSNYVVLDKNNIAVESKCIGLYDVALSGFDVEFGGRVFGSPISVFGGYYHFGFSKHQGMIYGPRIRMLGKLNNVMSISAEIQKDNYRKLQMYAGLELKVRFDSSNKNREKFSRLQAKMEQMPVRDIDIVHLTTRINESRTKFSEYELVRDKEALKRAFERTTLIEGEEKQSSSRNTRNLVILVGNDIDFENENIEPFVVGNLNLIGISDEQANMLDDPDQRVELGEVEPRLIHGYTILRAEDTNVGFFKILKGALLKNLRFQGRMVLGANIIGGVAGKATDTVFSNIINATPVSASNSRRVKKGVSGGIVGFSKNTSFINCQNGARISGVNAVGGIAGYAENSTFIDVINVGEILGKKDMIGGIAGVVEATTIRKASNRGVITGNDSVGGIFGVGSNARFEGNVVNIGGVTGKESTGGIIGLARSVQMEDVINYGPVSSKIYVGGIAGGLGYNSELINVENHGTIVGAEYVGGIAGTVTNDSKIIRAGNYQAVQGCAVIGGITGSLVEHSEISDSTNYSAGEVVLIDINNEEKENERYQLKTATANLLGGIVGLAKNSSIVNVENRSIVSNSSSIDSTEIMSGGIVGFARETEVSNSINIGIVAGKGQYGGIAGALEKSVVRDSSNHGKVASVSSYAGGIAAMATRSTITHVSNEGAVISSLATGGILGVAYDTKVDNAHNHGDIHGGVEVGGIVGDGDLNTIISDSENHGTIVGQVFCGGIVGGLSGNSIMSNVKNFGDVGKIDKTTASGGLAGNSYKNSEIINSTNSGTVRGINYTGGIVGLVDDNASISTAHNTGEVEGVENTGGIVGNMIDSSVQECINNADVIGQKCVGGLAGMATNSELNNNLVTLSVLGDVNTGGLVGETQFNVELSNNTVRGNVIGKVNPVAIGGLVGLLGVDDVLENNEFVGEVFGLTGNRFVGTDVNNRAVNDIEDELGEFGNIFSGAIYSVNHLVADIHHHELEVPVVESSMSDEFERVTFSQISQEEKVPEEDDELNVQVVTRPRANIKSHKRRDVIKYLKDSGYRLLSKRGKGSHSIYINDRDFEPPHKVVLPHHNEIKRGTLSNII